MGNVAAEYDVNGQMMARYVHGLELIEREDANGGDTIYTFGPMGHTSEMVDSGGSVPNGYAYDPWGGSLRSFESLKNPFQYAGNVGVMDEGCGLLFMRNRFYDAELGRFIQADPVRLAGGLNLYLYVDNDPCHGVDPSGLFNIPNGVLGGLTGFIGMPTWAGPVVGAAFGGLDQGDVNWLNHGAADVFDAGKNGVDWLNQGAADVFDFVHDFLPRPPSFHFPDVDWPNDPAVDPNIGPSVFLPPDFPPDDGDSSDVVHSFDPNDKLGPSGYGDSRFVQLGDILAYEVRFENKSDATAPARQIVITDVLDPNLDLDTFEWFDIAIGGQQINIPAGRDSYSSTEWTVANGAPLLVDVQAGLDYATRTLTVTLSALDPATGWFPEDPLVGLLYPEDGTGRGQGHITYVLSARPGLTTGTTITNVASIVFDYNSPILTPVVTNTIDVDAPTSHIVSGQYDTQIERFLRPKRSSAD
jgi:RHS repeat-associated protein/uncharacterized repeat protein (TIGR01451 family)